jgi:serine protease inhibitor
MQILEMPYSHGDIAMDILLPRTKDGLAAAEKKLDGDGFTKLVGTLKNQQVDVALPKWKVRTAVQMKTLFQQLGMTRAFDSRADFSGMVEKKALSQLYIDQIYHQGFVAVDEAGTEAAAATAVVMNDESAHVVPEAVAFRADHPFAWVIRDLATGEILFYGRVVDPRS